MVNKKLDKDQIIKKFRKNPRKPWIWNYLNSIIDSILKKELKDSPLLKYYPFHLIEPLWHCYYILKSKYWTNIYDQFVNDDYSDPSFRMIWSLTRFIDVHIPLYIRIVSLLMRIVYDRLEFSVYRELPPLPSELYLEPEFHQFGTINTTIYAYIDKLTNNASLKIKEFFIEAIGIDLNTKPIHACLSENLLLPIPTYYKNKYHVFLETCRQKFSNLLFTPDKIDHGPISVRDKNGTTREEKMIFYTSGATEYIRKPRFVNLMIHLIEFLERIYSTHLLNAKNSPLKNDYIFFYFLFNEFKQNPSRPVKIIHDVLASKLILKDISEDILNKYTYFPAEQKNSLADPLTVNNLFRFSLDLFEKPIIKDCYGFAYFSLLWLFDSLISRLTSLFREKWIGLKRGFKTEKYYWTQIQKFLNDKYPKSNAIGPFKLVLINEKKRNTIHTINAYNTLVNYTKRFGLKYYEIYIPPISINNLDFVEFDLALIIKDTIFILEIKDDIFWDIRDLPYILIRWGFNLQEQLKKRSDVLKEPLIAKKLNDLGFTFKKIKTMLISQKNIIHPVFNTLTDLFTEIHKVHGKMVIYMGAM